jgi:hypothetical protein
MAIKLVMQYDQELSKWPGCNFMHSDNPQLIMPGIINPIRFVA